MDHFSVGVGFRFFGGIMRTVECSDAKDENIAFKWIRMMV